MILTASYLSFSRVDTDIMLEAIPLRDIKRVAKTHAHVITAQTDPNMWVTVRKDSIMHEAPPGLELAGLHSALNQNMEAMAEERSKYNFGFEIETDDDGTSFGTV